MLVAPQALKSMLPIEDSFSNKEMRTFNRIHTECSWLLRRSRACFQSKIPFLIRKCAHLIVSTHISLQVKHLTQVCEGRKQASFCQSLRHCGSGNE